MKEESGTGVVVVVVAPLPHPLPHPNQHHWPSLDFFLSTPHHYGMPAAGAVTQQGT